MPDTIVDLLVELKALLPREMREQLNHNTLTRAYPLLMLISNHASVQSLQTLLLQQHPAAPTQDTFTQQALAALNQLRQSNCDHLAPFKFRLPVFLGEYPVHSKEINRHIHQFNQLIESYHKNKTAELNQSLLNQAYQAILSAITQHHTGSMPHSLWQLLLALSAWSTIPIDHLFKTHSFLLSPALRTKETSPKHTAIARDETNSIVQTNDTANTNKDTVAPAFIHSFDYGIDAAGRIKPSTYLLLNGFGLKPGGHTDALFKSTPSLLPWIQFKSIVRRQLSQLLSLSLDDNFFYWFQTVLQLLGVEFIQWQSGSHHCYVNPFLNEKTSFNTLNEEMVHGILQDQCSQMNMTLEPEHQSIISRYLVRLLKGFQFHRGQALGIGANWGGVVSESNEAGADAFRFQDSEWASHFKMLSLHRQGPAEARMNAGKGVTYELQALCSNFDYMTQLQRSEYQSTLFNALVDNLIATLFPEPPYFENNEYTKYRRQYIIRYPENGTQETTFFYQEDPQGTYFKTKKGEYKQTPMFRPAGSLAVEPFPRDTGSGDGLQSLLVANPLWPLQLQYAQASCKSVRGHIVYNPIGSDTFIPDTFYGQTILEGDDSFIPFIGVVPKNFDAHFGQVELCASFVVRMMHSSRIFTHCPTFNAYYSAILTQFLPHRDIDLPLLPKQGNKAIENKWAILQEELKKTERTATGCYKAYMSLFKELVHSLYSLTKEEIDLHFYFVELTTSPEAFAPTNRATCERIIRELTTLKPLPGLQNEVQLQYYTATLDYLSRLIEFFFPYPNDETAKFIAEQSTSYATLLLSLPAIQDYFLKLKTSLQENISPKLSPGMMHDAIKYQAPSPNIKNDYMDKRHATNFYSGYRDADGNHMVEPSTRETLLDSAAKTIGGLLPLFYRNGSIFSLITQPLSQAYIWKKEAQHTTTQYPWLQTLLATFAGFSYGIGYGVSRAFMSFPRFIYNGLIAPIQEQHKPNHLLAISAAPANTPGLRAQAIMHIRDHLINLIASANDYFTSKQQLANLMLRHFNQIYSSLIPFNLLNNEHYQQLLEDAFPLDEQEWDQLSEPVIVINNNETFNELIAPYQLQIDKLFIYALYECLTHPNLNSTPGIVINHVIEKNKLKYPQDNALKSIVFYYANNEMDLAKDISQYEFNGLANKKLTNKEMTLRKMQTWMNKALDKQWILSKFLNQYSEIYLKMMNENNLHDFALIIPDNIKEPLHQLLRESSELEQIIRDYQLEPAEKEFLFAYAICYKRLHNHKIKSTILDCFNPTQFSDPSLSHKTREHAKCIQFMRREWQHFLPSDDDIQAIVMDIEKQISLELRPDLRDLYHAYAQGKNNLKDPKAFDIFYIKAQAFKERSLLTTPINQWVNTTLNIFLNSLLDEYTWDNENDPADHTLCHSVAIVDWLKQLESQKNELLSLLSQQIEQSSSFDHAAWRCKIILRMIEKSHLVPERLKKTGMQKLLRVICQHTDRITTTGDKQAKLVDIDTLCKYSITMEYALTRVKEKTPATDFIRAGAKRKR